MPPAFDFLGGVDLHNHVLPGVDDGAPDLATAVAMAGALADLGFTRLFATPHVMSDVHPNTQSAIGGALGSLRAELTRRGSPTVVSASAEYYLDADFGARLRAGAVLPLPGGHLLIEWSLAGPPVGLSGVIDEIQARGFGVIVAHPERYAYWHDQWGLWDGLLERGCRLQLNLLSLVGRYGRGAGAVAAEMLRRGMVTFVGSDCHEVSDIEAIAGLARRRDLMRLLRDAGLRNADWAQDGRSIPPVPAA